MMKRPFSDAAHAEEDQETLGTVRLRTLAVDPCAGPASRSQVQSDGGGLQSHAQGLSDPLSHRVAAARWTQHEAARRRSDELGSIGGFQWSLPYHVPSQIVGTLGALAA